MGITCRVKRREVEARAGDRRYGLVRPALQVLADGEKWLAVYYVSRKEKRTEEMERAGSFSELSLRLAFGMKVLFLSKEKMIIVKASLHQLWLLVITIAFIPLD